MNGDREIRLEALTRVEGEGGLRIRMSGDSIEAVELNIYEPPRFFEAFLRGRPVSEVPDIVARICGICPVAYQMSAVHALERAHGVNVTPGIRRVRRLLYCGEWIESHALHIHLLQAPDFFGCASGIELARQFPQEVTRGLRLKKHGNELLDVLGGRAIHPINVAVGGFYRSPPVDRIQKLIPDFEWGLQAAAEMTRWVAGFDFPDFETDAELVSLVHPDEYPMNEGEIGTDAGERIPVADFEAHFQERQVPHSTALQAVHVSTGQPYLVGPPARVALNYERLAPTARRLVDELGLQWPDRNPFRAIIARALEVVHAYEEALGILKTWTPLRPARVAMPTSAGSGTAATEAPRGLLYHRYVVNPDGTVAESKIVPPTSQNQGQIESHLRDWLTRIVTDDDTATARHCENLVRAYDPCISCATHFLKVQIDRG